MNFLQDLGLKTETPNLYGDNQGTLALAKNTSFRPRTKHIHVCERFIAQLVQNGQCTICYVPTLEIIADALTKALPRERHETLTRRMGLQFGNKEPNKCNKCNGAFHTCNDLHRHLGKEMHYCDEQYPSISMIGMQSQGIHPQICGFKPQLYEYHLLISWEDKESSKKEPDESSESE